MTSSDGAGFERLSGALKESIVNTLGWRALRPVQTLAIDAILDGRNAVILAPTAGGKTEAAFFPLLSRMATEDWRPVSVVYLSPIRALLNNQEERARAYASLIGRAAFKWHGDVGPGERRRFADAPADILLTTPESLEAMMMGAKVPVRALFRGLEAVIVDEVHAFAGDDRGAHLSAVLERLIRFAGRDVQRIGLSATVGDPEAILAWLAGSSERAGAIVDPRGERKPAELSLDYVSGIENAAKVIEVLHPGKKRLVFVDSRRQAEELGKALVRTGVTTHVMHGSLSAPERRDAERAFAEGQDCVIVATSALELGIDVGDLDHVLQIESPSTVASFLQRLGRTGRRSGTAPNCTFLATTDAGLLRAAAIVQLYREGWVEPVEPSRRAAHVLAHQVMALAIQEQGIARSEWWTWVAGAGAFSELVESDRTAVVEHMFASNVLADHEGRLWLGEEGEKRYGRAGFRELYAVFDAPRLVTVRWDTQEIGTIDARFLASLDLEREPGRFTLGGRPWQIVHVEWERGLCAVRPATDGRAPRWHGSPRHLGYELCQAMRRILASEEVDPSWSRRAQRVMETTRAEHAFVRDGDTHFHDGPDGVTWWTFAGGAANLLLARMLEAELGCPVVARNVSLTAKTAGLVAVRQTSSTSPALGPAWSAPDSYAFARSAARSVRRERSPLTVRTPRARAAGMSRSPASNSTRTAASASTTTSGRSFSVPRREVPSARETIQ